MRWLKAKHVTEDKAQARAGGGGSGRTCRAASHRVAYASSALASQLQIRPVAVPAAAARTCLSPDRRWWVRAAARWRLWQAPLRNSRQAFRPARSACARSGCCRRPPSTAARRTALPHWRPRLSNCSVAVAAYFLEPAHNDACESGCQPETLPCAGGICGPTVQLFASACIGPACAASRGY